MPDLTERMAAEVVSSVRDMIRRSIAAIEAQINDLSAKFTELDKKDAFVRSDVEQLVLQKLNGELDDQFERALLALPKPKDGNDGKSVVLDDVRPIFDAALAQWALDFERRAQDVFAAAIERIPKPKDGIDGIGFDDFTMEYDGERTFTFKFQRGEQVKRFPFRVPFPLDRGVFRDEKPYEHGDGVTFGGSWHIAQKDAPAGKPASGSADWRLAVKRGQDKS